jgi:NitT/TauT family transport system substrate-binding protein
MREIEMADVRRIGAWWVAIMLACAAGSAVAQGLEKLTVRLDWVPWGIHAPIHLANQKGWFKAAGIEVEVEDGNGSVTTAQLVGSSKFDIGHASLAPMIIARDKGLEVKAIASFLRKNDIGLLVPKDSPIKSPKDLLGKKVIFTAGSLEAPFLDTFFAAGGLKREQVELVAVDAASKVPSYIAGRGDGVFSTVPFVLPAVAGSRASDALLFADHGLHFPSFGLLASEEKIKARGAAIGKFASIVAGAWEYVYAGNQDEAVQAIIAQRPQSKLDPKVLRAQIDALRSYFTTPASAGQPIGISIDADWSTGLKTLADGKLIKAGSKAADFYTNGLLDAALMKKTAGGGK